MLKTVDFSYIYSHSNISSVRETVIFLTSHGETDTVNGYFLKF